MEKERNIQTKMDAVNRFSRLLPSLNKVKNNGFYDKSGNLINLNGVIAFTNYIYITNNHFIGKVKVMDQKPADVPRYYDYNENVESERPKSQSPFDRLGSAKKDDLNQRPIFYNFESETWVDDGTYNDFCREYIQSFNSVVIDFKENLIKLNKEMFFNEIDAIFGKKENAKADIALLIKINPEQKRVDFRLLPISSNKKESFEFSLPMHIGPEKTEYHNYVYPAICSVNLYYFYNILQVFDEYKIVDIAFDNNINNRNPFTKGGVNSKPVIIKGVNPNTDWKPDIKFAVGQCKPKYSYEEKILY